MSAATVRCWGTCRNAGAVFDRLPKPGELTCGIHKHQDVTCFRPYDEQTRAASRVAEEGENRER